MMSKLKDYLVRPGSKVRLKDFPSRDHGRLEEGEGKKEFADLQERMTNLQERLYAEAKQALLVVFQAMDTGGKDSTIRSVLTPLHPTGVRVVSFKAPNETERHHDFLWRVHENTPQLGHIHVFNRSHYEDVLVVRVKRLAPEKRWRSRYEHINQFEELLHDDGTRVVKFFLHISKEYQKERLLKRLKNPAKHWKFNPADLADRKLWDDYQQAYKDALERCSTKHAPWYVIPAETRWYRDLLVARVLVETLESMDPKFPAPTFDPDKIVID
ncbi:MAG TPA: polyphosphate kinase 2 family protein [Phycisphaerae bacterium]|nr:polyphosphate kinase 2 family protein [Phycisphaerae bacterium]